LGTGEDGQPLACPPGPCTRGHPMGEGARHPTVVSATGVVEGRRVGWSSQGEEGARRRISVIELIRPSAPPRRDSSFESWIGDGEDEPLCRLVPQLCRLATCSRHLDHGRRGRTRGGGASGSTREEGDDHNEEMSFQILPCSSRHLGSTSPHHPLGPVGAAVFLFDTSLVDVPP
jgi:hypothetical protein